MKPFVKNKNNKISLLKNISIGNTVFESIRKNHSFYIDKTAFIEEWWENQDVATLIIRPRRFSKSLDLSWSVFSRKNMKAEENFLRDFSYGKRKNTESFREVIL